MGVLYLSLIHIYLVKDCGFAVFSGAAATGSVRAINVKGAAKELTRKEIDKLTEFVKTYGARGLAFSRWTAEAQSSSCLLYTSRCV